MVFHGFSGYMVHFWTTKPWSIYPERSVILKGQIHLINEIVSFVSVQRALLPQSLCILLHLYAFGTGTSRRHQGNNALVLVSHTRHDHPAAQRTARYRRRTRTRTVRTYGTRGRREDNATMVGRTGARPRGLSGQKLVNTSLSRLPDGKV